MQSSSQRREIETGRGAVPRQPAESGGPPARRESNAPPDRSDADQANPSPPSAGDESVAVGGVYVISVAARLLDMHPQTLRKYERVGLVVPTRSIGMLRLYSTEDIVRLRLIKHMVDNLGMNLAGVEFALNLLNRMMKLRERVKAMSRADALQMSIEKEVEEMLGELVGILQQDRADAEDNSGESK